MADFSHHDDVELGRLISMLPPAPQGWVEAAQQMPAARETIDQIIARCERDQAFRQALVDNVEATLREAGYELEPRFERVLRERL